jgi:hypothetical protein
MGGRLATVLMWCVTLVYIVLFVGVNWDGWSPGLLIPPWFVAIGIYAWRESIDRWGRRFRI